MDAENELGKAPWWCMGKGRESSVIDDDHSLFTLSIQKDEVFINIEKRALFRMGNIHFWICRGGSEKCRLGQDEDTQ